MKIPAGCGLAFIINKGKKIKLLNTHGGQVIDTWAYNLVDIGEYFSTQHTRSCLEKLIPEEGDYIFTNKRRPILQLLKDTSQGIHDMLLSACDIERYKSLGHEGYHKNCADNFWHSLRNIGYKPSFIPSPWNIFENVTLTSKNRLLIEAPTVKAGQYILLQAEMDLLMVLSACPMDIVPTNGQDCIPKDIEYQIS